MKACTIKKCRRVAWFIGLYLASILVIGGVSVLLRLVVGLPV